MRIVFWRSRTEENDAIAIACFCRHLKKYKNIVNSQKCPKENMMFIIDLD